PQELNALAGLYRTIDTVSVFEGIAIRFTKKARCSMIFLAGTPRQDFRYSILTRFFNTKLVTTPAGLRCYHVLWPKSEDSFSRANALKEMFGSPGNYSSGSIMPCFSETGYMVLVDGSGHAMQKLSNDPLEQADLPLGPPLGPPPPAVYVNDEPASRLGNVMVEIGNFTAKIVVRSSNNFEVLGCISKSPSMVQRCFGLVFPWPAHSLTGGLPFGHPLRKLNWNDACLCRDPQLVTYLVIGQVRVRLKKDTLSGVYRTNSPISVLEGVAGSGYVMRKISDDPHEVLDLPLQPPPSGVYVNDVPVPGLGGVTVKIDDKSECSTKIAVTGGISLKFSGA
ncbi:hypothetical protein FOZ63_009678, partial [Perkinsus olseni]